MKLPLYSEQNYAMHLVASSCVELFPNFQLLDFSIYPDRFCIDFSFARELSKEEIGLVKDRFFEKVKRSEQGDIREMVSKNACDLLKHYKQIFLTGLVDREEMFTEMLCMDTYNAPLVGEIDQDQCGIKDLQIKMYDLGEKKWMKRKVHHYLLEVFSFYSKADRKRREEILKDQAEDHLERGKREQLFWVEDGEAYFSAAGEKKFSELIAQVEEYFGDKVYFREEGDEFYRLSGATDFFKESRVEGNYEGISYGLKATNEVRIVECFSFSNNDLKASFESFASKLGLKNFSFAQDQCVYYDYAGTPFTIAEFFDENSHAILEINLQTIFAMLLESKKTHTE